MKLEMDLVRLILLEMEKTAALEKLGEVKIVGHDAATIAGHMILMHEAGLISVLVDESFESVEVFPQKLLWQGHEFLANARDDRNWLRTKSIAGKAGAWSMDALKMILSQVAAEAISRSFKS